MTNDPKDKEILKPCPFCGLKVTWDGKDFWHRGTDGCLFKTPNLNEWQNAWAHKEIETLKRKVEVYRGALNKIPKILDSIKYDKKEDRHYVCGPTSCELVMVDDVVKEAIVDAEAERRIGEGG